MANTKLKTVAPFISAETLTSKFAATATLATAGATIPNNAGEVWVYPSAACHWNPNGAATATFPHAIAALEWIGPIAPRHHTTAQFIGDAGAINVTIVYMRGARRSDGKHAVTRPY